MTVVAEDVLALHQDYWENGESLTDVARRLGCSREAIRQLFKKHALPTRSNHDLTTLRHHQLQQQAHHRREEILSLYRQHGNIPTVTSLTGLPRDLISQVISTLPHRNLYQHRGSSSPYTRQDLTGALQRAAAVKGQPLTIPAYRQAAGELGLPSYDTIVKHFFPEDPEYPWQCALESAGVKGNAPRSKRPRFPFEACVAAVRDYIQAVGIEQARYEGYKQWRRQGMPSGPTVRSTVGWNLAVELALDQLDIA